MMTEAAPACPDAASAFAPHDALARRLLMLIEEGSDGSHDRSHILRVWSNAAAIARTETSCDLELLATAVILHDCVALEKNSPARREASRLAAERARAIMEPLGFDAARLEALEHAIIAHSFSANVPPQTLEARILQDADRLDAIGAIGIARCFYIAGRLGAQLYEPTDPLAKRRPYDDARFALDHFEVKLLRLAEGFQTSAGRMMARERDALMRRFLADFAAEIGG